MGQSLISPWLNMTSFVNTLFVFQVQAEIDELELVVLEQQDKLTIREKLSYMTSRAVQMPLGITLVLFAFQVNDFPFMEDKYASSPKAQTEKLKIKDRKISLLVAYIFVIYILK
jgi:hypothetical protein